MLELKQIEQMIEKVKLISIEAGKEIMRIYESEDFGVEAKSDDSPLTKADKNANDYIVKGLESLETQIPIISEENKEIEYSERSNYTDYWLVDPLDGTKEFIKRNGEFTVNIALISNGIPFAGVVYAPALEELYWAIKGHGAFLKKNGETTHLRSKSFKKTDPNLKIVCSRSHLNERTANFMAAFDRPEKVATGSSLKFLIMAKGEAHIYPRLAPTMEWDTGAAQIILEESGGKVLSVENDLPLGYNKESLVNPHFVAYANEIS